MKLIRFGEPGREKPGVILSDGRRLDVSGFGSDYDETFFAALREGGFAPAATLSDARRRMDDSF